MKFKDLKYGEYFQFAVRYDTYWIYVRTSKVGLMTTAAGPKTGNIGMVINYTNLGDCEVKRITAIPPSLDNIFKHIRNL